MNKCATLPALTEKSGARVILPDPFGFLHVGPRGKGVGHAAKQKMAGERIVEPSGGIAGAGEQLGEAVQAAVVSVDFGGPFAIQA